jgi:hypothetical protein
MHKTEKALIFQEFIKNYGFYRSKLFEDNYIFRNFAAQTKLIHDNCIFDVMPNEFTLFLQFHKKFSIEVSSENNNKYFNVTQDKNLIKLSNILYKASLKHVSYNELVSLFKKLT